MKRHGKTLLFYAGGRGNITCSAALDLPLLLWTSDHTGTARRHLLCARYGKKYVKWFCPTTPSSTKDRLAAAGVHALVRNAVGLSRPIRAPVNQAWKVTGVGMTFAGADIFHLMEKILPDRFGGSAMDYQLVEHDDIRGLPRNSIFISPDVGPVDEEKLRETFLNELGSQWSVYRWMVEVWRQADVLSVRREKSIATRIGKVLPFRTLASEVGGNSSRIE